MALSLVLYQKYRQRFGMAICQTSQVLAARESPTKVPPTLYPTPGEKGMDRDLRNTDTARTRTRTRPPLLARGV